jgi:hypothetical protein
MKITIETTENGWVVTAPFGLDETESATKAFVHEGFADGWKSTLSTAEAYEKMLSEITEFLHPYQKYSEGNIHFSVRPGHKAKGEILATNYTVAVDCDETLWTKDEATGNQVLTVRNRRIIDLCDTMERMGWNIVCWSGGGKEHAERCLRLIERYWEASSKTKEQAEELNPDIVLDDQDVKLGKLNLRV